MTDYRPTTPPWADELSLKYSSGIAHAFLLHGNVNDYVVANLTVRSYLHQMLVRNSAEIVVFYDISEGFSFLNEDHKESFVRALSLDSAQGRADAQRAGLLFSGEGPVRHDPAFALMLITRLLRQQSQKEVDGEIIPGGIFAVIISNAELLFPNKAGGGEGADRVNLQTALNWGRDMKIARAGNMLVMLTNTLADISPALRSASARTEAVEISLPTVAQRLEWVEWWQKYSWLDYNTGEEVNPPPTFEMSMSNQVLAEATNALQLVHLEDLFLRADMIGELSMQDVNERKTEIIASEYDDVLELWQPKLTFEDIGGLDHIKTYFRDNVISPMLQGGEALRVVPMGVLMAGPAGTGKSVMAEAIATEAEISAVQLNLSKIFDMWVGSSERNAEKLRNAFNAFGRLIVFIDEIDQTISRGEAGDGGTSKRIFKMLLELMSDTTHRGQIVFLAATNRPDLIDAALRRPGRFDRTVAFLMPDEAEQLAIIDVMARKHADLDKACEICGEDFIAELLQNIKGWTGAELENAAVKALEICAAAGTYQPKAPAFMKAYKQATERLVPNTADVEFMTNLALQAINDLDLLPPAYREIMTKKGHAGIEKEVQNFKRKRRDFSS